MVLWKCHFFFFFFVLYWSIGALFFFSSPFLGLLGFLSFLVRNTISLPTVPILLKSQYFVTLKECLHDTYYHFILHTYLHASPHYKSRAVDWIYSSSNCEALKIVPSSKQALHCSTQYVSCPSINSKIGTSSGFPSLFCQSVSKEGPLSSTKWSLVACAARCVSAFSCCMGSNGFWSFLDILHFRYHFFKKTFDD